MTFNVSGAEGAMKPVFLLWSGSAGAARSRKGRKRESSNYPERGLSVLGLLEITI